MSGSGSAVDSRCYEQCAEILRDLGLNRVRLMSNNPEKLTGARRNGNQRSRARPAGNSTDRCSRGYLLTKKEKMGHLLEMV